MEKLDFSKLINHHFIDYLFASEAFKYHKFNEGPFLNRDTIVHKQTTNELLILQPVILMEDLSLYLWVIDLHFILEDPKSGQNKEDYLKQLKEKYFVKTKITFTAKDNKTKLTFNAKTPYSEIPFDFILNIDESLIAFSTQNRVFIGKMDIKEKKSALEATEIKLEDTKTPFNSLKWHPEAPSCLGILVENKFYIYDTAANIDSPEFSLSLSYKKKSRSHAISFPQEDSKSEDQISFVDFTFCTQDGLEDLRFLTVFFMSITGDIYYYCPVILPGMSIKAADLELKKETLERALKEDYKEYYEKFFENLKTISKPVEDKLVFRSIKNTSYETLSTKNSIQGPIAKVDGGEEKSLKKRKDYVKFYRFPNKKGHIFVTMRKSGKVAFLFSLNNAMPNSKSHPTAWNHEAPFKFAVISKFQLQNFLPELKPENQPSKQVLSDFEFVRNNTKIKFLSMNDDGYTKVMLSYYNRIYLFHLEWADIIERNLDSKPLASRLSKREDFRTNCELILDSEAEIIDPKGTNLDKFKPFLFGYYGFSLVLGNLFVINTNGDFCDYSFLRVMSILELRQIRESYLIDRLSTDNLTEDHHKLKELFKENQREQLGFEEMITKAFPALNKKIDEKNLEESQKNLSAIEDYLYEVSKRKERIENSFAEQIQMLLEVRQKQRAFFKRLGEKVKELCDKRKAIEEGIFNRLIERNDKIKARISELMGKMRNIISPLSESDIRARETLDELRIKIDESRTLLKGLKEEYEQIKKRKSESKGAQAILPQDQEIFEEFNRKYKDLRSELKTLQDEFAVYDQQLQQQKART